MRVSRYLSKNPYVDFFFFVQSDSIGSKQQTVQLFPDGRSVMVFNLGDKFVEKEKKLPNYLLSSTCTESHILNVPSCKIDLIGIQFKAYGLYPFIQPAMKEMASQIHSLELLFGSEVKEIEEKLFHTDGVFNRIEIIEAFLEKRTKKNISNQIEILINDINNQQGCLSVSQLVQKYGVSERSIERDFGTYLGINPKKYIRLTRFQAIVATLRETPADNLTSIAYKFGYADQSHFIKEFKEFTQLTPSHYQKNSPPSDFYNFER